MFNAASTIWLIEDDEYMREMLVEYLSSQGLKVQPFELATQAFEKVSECQSRGERLNDVGLIISDVQMPEMDGMEFLERIKKAFPEVPVLLMTAYGSIDAALEATRKGAFDYLTKPFKLDEVSLRVKKALEWRLLHLENESLKSQVQSRWTYGKMIGKSQAMTEVFDLLDRVSKATANVLITGESGTGKELVAWAIHNLGPRASKPFIAINCTAIPESLLESELFGHAKGAFTGAIQRKKGLFEEADGGTIFLDEIGDMEFSLQAKILRVVQEKVVRPVGETQGKSIDVRIISATHKDLLKAVKEERFREDLYYRLSVVPVHLPPLRHRREDIPLLVHHFLEKFTPLNRSKVKGFTPAAMEKLINAPWEGNVRELENFIERMVVLGKDEYIDEKDLYQIHSQDSDGFWGQIVASHPTLEEIEKKYMQFVLNYCGGKKEKASQILGVSRRTLYRKEREYGLVSESETEESEGLEGEEQ